MNWFLSFAALFIALGRFTIPGHGLTGWPGFYEALAHLLLGAMIAIAWTRRDERTYAWFLVIMLTLLEVLMFKAQGA
jgi:hypothetical protein